MKKIIQTAIDTNGVEKTREIFKNRLSAELKKNDMTQTELSDKLGKILGVEAFRQATISVWVNGKALPRRKYLESMAEILNVDAEYLLGLQDTSRRNVVIKNTNGALELLIANLKYYDNQPVWCVYKNDDISDGFWAMVDAGAKELVTTSTRISYSRIDFNVYEFLSPYTYAIESNLDVLTKEEIRYLKKLWVQGIGSNFAARKKISGYYLYDNAIDCVVSNSGHTLSLNTYGVNWVAYNEKIIDKEPKKLN